MIHSIGVGGNPTQAAHLILSGAATYGTDAELFINNNGILTCGSFDCAIVDVAYADPESAAVAGRFSASAGEIQIASPVAGAVHSMELLAEDLGPNANVWGDGPGIIGTLRFGPSPAPMMLVYNQDNTRLGVPETIYVRDLILEDGITLDLNGGTIYYGTITPEDPFNPGSGVTIIGPGNLVQVVSPSDVEGSSFPDAGRSQLSLAGAAPNPLAGHTTIHFQAAAETEVTLRVFDVNGQLVRTLIDGMVGSGQHAVEWDGRNTAGRPLASGAYFYALEGAGQSEARRITLIQ